LTSSPRIGRPRRSRQAGSGDLLFVASLVDSLDDLGASDLGALSPDKDLEVASTERNAIRLALLIARLTR
jgi:glutamate carboxypeptidase